MHSFPSDLPDESPGLVPPNKRPPTAVGVLTPPPPPRPEFRIPQFSNRAFRTPLLVSLELVAARLLAAEVSVPVARVIAEVLFAGGLVLLGVWTHQILIFFRVQREATERALRAGRVT